MPASVCAAQPTWRTTPRGSRGMRSSARPTRMSARASRTMPVRSSSSMTSRMHVRGRALLQRHGRRVLMLQNPPAKPLDHRGDGSRLRAARICAPTTRPTRQAWRCSGHSARWSFPSFTTGAASVACNFCALAFHQGRYIQVRSHESVIEEAEEITQMRRASRAISMMSAVRRRISASRPARSSDTHGLLPGQALSVPELRAATLTRITRITSNLLREAAPHRGHQEGFRPLGSALRLYDGGQERCLLQRTGRASPFQRPAQGRA